MGVVMGEGYRLRGGGGGEEGRATLIVSVLIVSPLNQLNLGLPILEQLFGSGHTPSLHIL